MSSIRVTNIEAKADASSPTVNEKVKITKSSGDVMLQLDGAASGITTIGINTTGTWVSENTESVVEYNESATGISTVYFEDFMGGYAAGESQNAQKPSATTVDASSGPTSKKNYLSQNYDSTDSEIFSVRVSNISDTSTNVGVSIRWREIY